MNYEKDKANKLINYILDQDTINNNNNKKNLRYAGGSKSKSRVSATKMKNTTIDRSSDNSLTKYDYLFKTFDFQANNNDLKENFTERKITPFSVTKEDMGGKIMIDNNL